VMVIELITGFSTERTAEYIILHDLYEKIKDQYTLFYPFFYQKNRDDTHLSTQNQIEELHLLTCFARRPKTNVPDSPYSEITFRSSLFKNTNYFSSLGIPTIVGAPIGTSIDKIGFGSRCCWFQLYPTQDDSYTACEFMNGELYPPKNDFISILSNNDLRKLLSHSPKYSWYEILSIVHEWNLMFKEMYPMVLFNTLPGQKPVFIVYK
jgi:hypothetical protein